MIPQGKIILILFI